MPVSTHLMIEMTRRDHGRPSLYSRLTEAPMIRHLLYRQEPDRRFIVSHMCFLYVLRHQTENNMSRIDGRPLPHDARTSLPILDDLQRAGVDTETLHQHPATQPIKDYFQPKEHRAARVLAQLYLLVNWDLLCVGPKLQRSLRNNWPVRYSYMSHLTEVSRLNPQRRERLANRLNHALDRWADKLGVHHQDVVQAMHDSADSIFPIMNSQIRAIHRVTQAQSQLMLRFIALAAIGIIATVIAAFCTTPNQSPRFEL